MPTEREIEVALAHYQKQKEASRRYYQTHKAEVCERRKARYHAAHPDAPTRNRKPKDQSSSPLGDEPSSSVSLPTFSTSS
jgi:hypothetical protein